MEQHSRQKERDLSVLIAMLQCIFFIHRCRDSSVIDFYRKAVRAVSFQKSPVTEQLKGSYCIQLSFGACELACFLSLVAFLLVGCFCFLVDMALFWSERGAVVARVQR